MEASKTLKGKSKPELCTSPENLKRFRMSKKALSPIFATLIILAVVTVLFIPVFIWATGTTSQTQDSWQISGLIATERIVIEEVSLKFAQESCIIYLRNIGKTAVTVNDVLILSPTGEVYTYEKAELTTRNPVTGDPQMSIIQGELIEIEITDLKGLPVSEGASRDQVFVLRVFTTRGVGGEYQIVLEA